MAKVQFHGGFQSKKYNPIMQTFVIVTNPYELHIY